MTGQLRATLHERAADLEPWDVDLGTVVHDGDRRLRRRRTALAGGLAALVALGGVSALALRGHDDAGPGPAADPTVPFTYAVGSVIHAGTDTVDVGRKVVSFVPTHWGFVFSTTDRRLYQERDGQVRPITTFDGHPSHLGSDTTRLVVSDDGLVTAWWDGAAIQTWPGYRDGGGMVDAFDKTDSFEAQASWPDQDPPRVEALSDGHLWWWDGRDHWIAEVRPLTTTAGWQDSNPADSPIVVDAAGDQVLVRTHDGMAVTGANLLPEPVSRQDGWRQGGELADVRTQVAGVVSGDLAPDGQHWFTDNSDRFAVYDSTSGRRQDPAHPGYGFAAPYEWLDSDTMAVLALEDPSAPQPSVSLLTCHVSSNDCTVTAPDIGTYADIALPVGARLGD